MNYATKVSDFGERQKNTRSTFVSFNLSHRSFYDFVSLSNGLYFAKAASKSSRASSIVP